MTKRAEALPDAEGQPSGAEHPDQARPCWGCTTPTTGVVGLLHKRGPMWLPYCGECNLEPLPKGSLGIIHPEDLLGLCKHLGRDAPDTWVERSDSPRQPENARSKPPVPTDVK